MSGFTKREPELVVVVGLNNQVESILEVANWWSAIQEVGDLVNKIVMIMKPRNWWYKNYLLFTKALELFSFNGSLFKLSLVFRFNIFGKEKEMLKTQILLNVLFKWFNMPIIIQKNFKKFTFPNSPKSLSVALRRAMMVPAGASSRTVML